MTRATRFLVVLSLLATMPGLTGCQAPLPPVTTLWDKLGVTQAYTTIRDNRLNKNGNRPWKEWKPPKLRLADPRNLLSPVPAIKVAAEVKVAEDLADQKIKALKYLGMIGCGCYDADKSIQNAFLDALHDCTPCVRLAAIEALQMTADQCNEQAQRFERRRNDCLYGRDARRGNGHCGHCGGGGCAACASGIVTSESAMLYQEMVYKDSAEGVIIGCEACGGSGCGACAGGGHACESCLGKEICKRLAEMAYKQDDNGCWVEPVPEIRAAAANLLAWCPAPEPEPVVPDSPEIEGGVEGEGLPPVPDDTTNYRGAAGGFITVAQPGQMAPVVPANTPMPVNANQPWMPPTNPWLPGAMPMQPAGAVPQQAAPPEPLAPIVRPTEVSTPAANQTVPADTSIAPPPAPAEMPTFYGQVVAADGDQLAIQFENAYRLPDGARLVIASPQGIQTELAVVASDVGVVLARITTPGTAASELNGSPVEIGILP